MHREEEVRKKPSVPHVWLTQTHDKTFFVVRDVLYYRTARKNAVTSSNTSRARLVFNAFENIDLVSDLGEFPPLCTQLLDGHFSVNISLQEAGDSSHNDLRLIT